ncbi:hypothetical protein [Polynucleobacter sp. UK-Kesae-W10]|nr:hypothetical protein [Polynucleobacter sp. UK-Kesae-W10]MBU3577567.1 hypothetical protein [Polynucleobacter sp. UK-Kesae-W10]
MSNLPINETQDSQVDETNATQGLDLDSDAPLAPACPLNPADGTCEACQ